MRIAVIGLGRLGSPLVKALARKHFGPLLLVDRDIVEVHSVYPGSLYRKKDLQSPKAIAALRAVGRSAQAFAIDLNRENINILDSADVLVECLDNLETRFLLGAYAYRTGKPLIHCAASPSAGVIAVFEGKPCFSCVYAGKGKGMTCEGRTIDATIAAKICGQALRSLVDIHKGIPRTQALKTTLRRFTVSGSKAFSAKANEACPVCASKRPKNTDAPRQKTYQLCGRNMFQFHASPIRAPYKIISQDITHFRDGRVLVKAKSLSAAKRIFEEYTHAH